MPVPLAALYSMYDAVDCACFDESNACYGQAGCGASYPGCGCAPSMLSPTEMEHVSMEETRMVP